MATSASFEARSAPLPYPTVSQRTYGSVRGVPGDRYPYRDRYLAPYPYQHALRGTMNGDGKTSGKGGFRGLKAP